MELLGDLERLAASLYPLRIPIGIGGVLVLILALTAAYRLRLHEVIGRHRRAAAVFGGLALVVLAPTGYYLASPLWTRTSLVEPVSAIAAGAIPIAQPAESQAASGAPAGASAPVMPPMETFSPRVIQRGEFIGADAFHFGRGRALISEVAPGRYTLRVEDFSVRNGPDLFVYLSPNPNGYAADATNLGRLKATDGAFSYDVPEGTKLSDIKSVIVWCRQFSVLFATATLG